MKSVLDYPLLHWGGYQLTLGQLIGVALIALVAWFAVAVVRRLFQRAVERRRYDRGRSHSLALIVQYVVWLAAGMGTLQVLGIDISVLLAGSAAVLVGITLSLQQIFRDLACGVFLLLEGTIEIGDVLVVDGTVGRVVEINLRTSKLRTADGMIVIVPNNKFIIEKVNNWSHQDQSPSRFAIAVQVAGTHDENALKELLLDCARVHPDVVSDDEKRRPAVRLTDFTKTDLMFELQFWTLRKWDVEVVKSDLRFAIRERFRQEGILGGEPAPAPQASAPAKETNEEEEG
jgi:small-conductance mechanosensitive channel